jgi:hypothetical protein
VRSHCPVSGSWRGLGLATEAIDRRLKIIADVLNSPAEHLHVVKREPRLDRMNVIVENGYAREVTTIELRLASVPETAGAVRAFALVKFATLRSTAGAEHGR